MSRESCHLLYAKRLLWHRKTSNGVWPRETRLLKMNLGNSSVIGALGRKERRIICVTYGASAKHSA